jgi:hypothetical protein
MAQLNRRLTIGHFVKAVRAYYIIASTRFLDGIYQNAIQNLLLPLQVGPYSAILRELCVSGNPCTVSHSSPFDRLQ